MSPALLAAPTALLYAVLLGGPLVILAVESLRPHIAGGVGASAAGWTLANYRALFHVEYADCFRETVVLSLEAAILGIGFSFPLAHFIARTRARLARRLWFNLLVSALFLDLLIRSYALALLLGPTGATPFLTQYFGIFGNSGTFIRFQVVLGLLYFVIPLSTLTLIGPIENINPRLCEAALTLGAARWKSVLVTDVALSLPAMLSSVLMSFSLCVSAFTVPLILGKGFVVFIANLIYDRFSDIANFPSGAALAVLLLVFTLLIIYAISQCARLLLKIS